ncbi:hypothetical protein TEA_011098 [Camellia sinensis var. sinensis]|uniref:Uncharacterized protein n=1 Tax=Camellia sinensis var. sinensis TaxID=542762 RepID=A0A4S4F1X2_CAMSN|nr:hypothetical protein TEA_011098 [Camellia sinensis var. sinensis]
MVKMHGLGDGPYWTISYAYFLVISSAYMLCFVIFGSVIGLKFFTLNDYSIQFVFYFIYINLQISLAFLIASVFSNVKTAAAVAYFIVFRSGLLGGFLFQFFIEDPSFPRGWIVVMELYPGFSLYRGLYEFSQHSFMGNYIGTKGMRWVDISDSNHGMRDILIFRFVEWLVVLFVAFYIDQVVSSGSGVGRSPLFFLEKFWKKPLSSSSMRKPSLRRQGSKVFTERVEQLLLEPTASHAIICEYLKKGVSKKRNGNPEKHAVRGLSLALPQRGMLGMLGPNGAAKLLY